jgi:hypothetical protein
MASVPNARPARGAVRQPRPASTSPGLPDLAVYGRALQAPEEFAGFLDVAGAAWMDTLRAAQGPDTDPEAAACRATLVIATIRGLLLDLLAGGDPSRVQRTAEGWLATL